MKSVEVKKVLMKKFHTQMLDNVVQSDRQVQAVWSDETMTSKAITTLARKQKPLQQEKMSKIRDPKPDPQLQH